MLAVQRDAVGRAVGIEDIAQHDAFAVRQLYGAQLFHLRHVDAVEHGSDLFPAERLMQIVAGVYLVALAGKFVAGRAKHQANLPVGLSYFPRRIHAGDPVHEDIEDHKIEPPGLPCRQKRFAARKAGQHGIRSEQLIKIGLQAGMHLPVIVHNSDLQSRFPPL